MTSNTRLKCMVKGCGTLAWYSNFPGNMHAFHKDIEEHSNIQRMWGRKILPNGELAPVKVDPSPFAVKPAYELDEDKHPETTAAVNEQDDDDDLLHEIRQKNVPGEAILRLLLHQTRVNGGNPRAILAPLLASDDSSDDSSSIEEIPSPKGKRVKRSYD
ncbi:hypothetical protein AeMF1_006204 [Aphanomyces euteiches]|nr:hypothetical protein AeMF1_006204 [Aphanomyces euteiches]KAH9183916.1 hypothetical protein AeNC1_014108 [Aphanomyces euteiches]